MSEASPVLPGAEAFRFDGGTTGVLMLHGFSGSPASMRPIGSWLAGNGLSVAGPRLPGHGTRWEDLAGTRWTDWVGAAEQALSELRARCERVAIVGQSMGGALALHLAATRSEEVAGLALLNPYVRDPRLAFSAVARPFVRTVKGVGSDISILGADEVAYSRIPVAALAGLRRLLRTVDRELPAVRAPLLVFRSGEDHAIPKGNPDRVAARAGSARKELVLCPNSYHVIALDRDAEMVRERVLEFIRSL